MKEQFIRALALLYLKVKNCSKKISFYEAIMLLLSPPVTEHLLNHL